MVGQTFIRTAARSQGYGSILQPHGQIAPGEHGPKQISGSICNKDLLVLPLVSEAMNKNLRTPGPGLTVNG